ncbi:hypothetical protein Fmac_024887 [Flemingia macrophylla]|uniref:Uncharacterized protein n=1 Tax=Flemingia macrophylla TaxID=520843 RepID=A0ABD1LQN3_9FABA
MMPLSLKEFTTWLQTHAETRKVEGKLDALVNFMTKLAVNQKPATFARVCGIRSSNEHHTNGRRLPTPSSFGARNDVIVIRGVHDVVTDTSAETRKVEGKLDALVNLVTQLAVNQKPASIAREISDETDRITGKTKAISNVPIQLSIYSPHEGQSETIVQDIENMVRSYIEKANDSSSVPNTPLEGRHSSEASNP